MSDIVTSHCLLCINIIFSSMIIYCCTNRYIPIGVYIETYIDIDISSLAYLSTLF
jgi:hypothetical protein